MGKFSFTKLVLAGLITVGVLGCGGNVGLAQSKDISIDGDHGKLAATLQTPAGQENYPLVIIMHGFTGNKDESLLITLADDLEKEGIASLRFDFNGHGKSEGRFQDMTVPNEIDDAKHVYEYVKGFPV